MARITLDGIDDILDELSRATEDMTEVVDRMLIAGGEIANEALQASIQQHGHIRTSSMYGSVRFEEPRLSMYSTSRYVSSYSRGADIKGTSNQIKSFVLNYGSEKRKIKASHWFDEAYENAAPRIEAAMRKVWDEWKLEKGKGV